MTFYLGEGKKIPRGSTKQSASKVAVARIFFFGLPAKQLPTVCRPARLVVAGRALHASGEGS